jgi:hypothetical protein
LHSLEAKSAGLSESLLVCSKNTNCHSFATRLHKANIFDENGVDPRVIQSRTGAGAMFAPIGFV